VSSTAIANSGPTVKPGDDYSMSVGERIVYFKHLPSSHKSEMAFEVGIIHPEAYTSALRPSDLEPTAGVLKIPPQREYHRFLQEDQAQAQFKVWVEVLTAQLEREQNARNTLQGRVVDNSDQVADLQGQVKDLTALVQQLLANKDPQLPDGKKKKE
jgi:hypothetical protein